MEDREIRELKIQKEEFFKILKEILDWEEKHFPVVSLLENNDRKLKRLFLELPYDKVTITILKLEPFVYFVVIQYKTVSGEVTTNWIHEDIIAKERLLLYKNSENICHKIITLTDLYELAEPVKEPFFWEETKLSA
ncbi:MAG: hypothetical protein ACK4UJ_05460 [Leptonema sp. (in: bacteria)]